MKLGVVVAGAGRGRERFDRTAALAQDAADAGFDSVWTNELYVGSAPVPMAVLAERTRRVQIGSGIAYGVGRSPLAWTMEARDLDELSEGRLLLGLGNGTARMMADWHGVDDSSAPAVRMEELVTVLRRLWRLHEGPVGHDGRFYRVHVRPAIPVPPPYSEHLPIYTAGVNERMIETAGRVADGLIGHPMFTSRYLDDVVRPAIERGARRTGRNPAQVSVVREVMCAVHDDPEQARAELSFAVAFYAASRVYTRIFDLHGWGEQQAAIANGVKSGDLAAVQAALSEEMLDAFGIACRPDELRGELAKRTDGVDHLVLTPPPWGGSAEEVERRITTLIQHALSREVSWTSS